MNNIEIVDEIVKYYMNPKKYPNNNKDIIEDAIKKLNNILLNGGNIESDTIKDLVNTLLKKYTSNKIDAPINATILKTRADEQGLSSTKGYKEIYFNEIVQNANDNTTSDNLDIILGKDEDEKNYEMIFRYNDKGFSVENIIGFFNTEIHTKRDNFSATGKHGVGIKSLFYFVNYMKIESNVRIEFKITTMIEEEIEKIAKVESKIEINEDWYNSKDKKTTFTIHFPQKDSYGRFNISKLKNFINLFFKDSKVGYDDINKYFFGLEQNNLIFDVRGLLFTDKNKGKNVGIKNLCFYKKNFEQKLFKISCIESKKFQTTGKRVCKAEIKYNNDTKLSYLVFTNEREDNQQNFSVAFPIELKNCKRRYYETYYIPEADEEGVNILVNSKYSNVTRTKLTDDDNEQEDIKEEIENSLNDLYYFMVSKSCSKPEIGEIGIEISVIFHKLLLLDSDFIEQCYHNKLNNRYLAKYKNEIEADDGKYIVYERKEKEEFEKKYIGQKFEKEEVNKFIENYILKNDTIKYDENLFIDEIGKTYEKAFKKNDQDKLRSVLNVAGTIRDLIYYRMKGIFPKNETSMLNDNDVDDWNKKIWNKKNSCENEKQKEVLISLSIIGRYKMHSYLKSTGEIVGASFYEYLFNKEQDDKNINSLRYPTFKSKQQELFNEQYSKLKNRMLNLLVNKEQGGKVHLGGTETNYEKGTVAFYYSHHLFAKNIYFDPDKIIMYDDYYDSDEFGADLTELLVKKIIEEKEILKHIIQFYDCSGKERMLLASYEYPLDYEQQFCWNKTLKFGELSKCKLININFIRNIYAHSWEIFTFYLKEFLEKQNIYNKCKVFKLSTYKQEKQLFGINVNDIAKIFKFFYENDRYKKKVVYDKVKFQIDLEGDIQNQNNLCPEDYYNYLQKQIDKKVYVMQTNCVNNRKEIMYWYEKEFKIFDGKEWCKIGTGIRTNTDEIIIIHNEKMDYKEAIQKVLKNILGKYEVLNKFDAFISADQNYAIQGEEYDDLTSYNNVGNQRSQKDVFVQNTNELSCEALKKIIIARGNNDNICCCCGMQLTKPRLIITNNSNSDTNKEYPQILEVVCEKCENILQKSHKHTTLKKENDGYYVDYCCNVQNSHQRKEIHFKFKLCDGVLALCRDPNKKSINC